MYDGKATMITLAVDDGANRDVIKNRVTHAKSVRDAFDHYYRGTQWIETCAELSKLKIARCPPTEVVGLPVTVEDGPTACYDFATASLSRVVAQQFRAGEGIRTTRDGVKNLKVDPDLQQFSRVRVPLRPTAIHGNNALDRSSGQKLGKRFSGT